MSEDIIIHKGDKLTHAGTNEVYATAIRDIARYTLIKRSDFEFPEGVVHKAGEFIPSDVVRAEDGHARHVHINGGWVDLRASAPKQIGWNE